MRSCATHVHKHSVETMLLQQCREVTTVILSITPWLPTYMGQSLIRCNRVCDLNLHGVLLADEMGLGKTCMVLAAFLYAEIVSNELVSNKEYKLSFHFGRTLHLWQEEVEQGFPGLSHVHRGWYPCTHARPLPHRLSQLLDNNKPTDIAPWHPVLCVVLPSVRETFVAATKTIMAGTHFTIRDLSAEGGAEMSHNHLNFSVKFPERMWDIHVVTYNALTERGQRNPSGIPRQLTKLHLVLWYL